MTLENSQPTLWPETELPSMSSAEGSRAKTLARREAEQDWTESAVGFGESSPVLLANLDPDMSSWRTSQHCLVEGLTVFSETWPRSGIMLNGTAYQLPPLVPLTAGTASGFWATPRASDGKGAVNPLAAGKAVSRGFSPNLPEMVTASVAGLWPTPSASDNRDRGNLSSPAVKRRASIGKQLMLSQVVSETSGALNPTWVEWLMGFPIGHTDLKGSETP